MAGTLVKDGVVDFDTTPTTHPYEVEAPVSRPEHVAGLCYLTHISLAALQLEECGESPAACTRAMGITIIETWFVLWTGCLRVGRWVIQMIIVRLFIMVDHWWPLFLGLLWVRFLGQVIISQIPQAHSILSIETWTARTMRAGTGSEFETRIKVSRAQLWG
jgi:hypothetical protein